MLSACRPPFLTLHVRVAINQCSTICHGHSAMTKSKKKSSRPLTHEEIWDDSALVRSWDEAVEEYKVRAPHNYSRDLSLTAARKLVDSSTTASMLEERTWKMF